MTTTHARRIASAALAALVALGLAGCGPGDEPSTGSTSTTAASGETPAIAGGDPFCDSAVASLTAAQGVTEASDDLSAAMAGGDVDALHSASQAILDNSAPATAFYAAGADVADDPAVEDAFTGLSRFVAEYSIPMGEAGVAAESVPEFLASVTTLFSNPELQTLLQSTPGWATTAYDFTVDYCGISA